MFIPSSPLSLIYIHEQAGEKKNLKRNKLNRYLAAQYRDMRSTPRMAELARPGQGKTGGSFVVLLCTRLEWAQEPENCGFTTSEKQ